MSVDDVRFDPARIVEELQRHGVGYVLVGVIAAQAHGATRATNDLDCVPQSTLENLQRLAEAMRDLGARLGVGGHERRRGAPTARPAGR